MTDNDKPPVDGLTKLRRSRHRREAVMYVAAAVAGLGTLGVLNKLKGEGEQLLRATEARNEAVRELAEVVRSADAADKAQPVALTSGKSGNAPPTVSRRGLFAPKR